MNTGKMNAGKLFLLCLALAMSADSVMNVTEATETTNNQQKQSAAPKKTTNKKSPPKKTTAKKTTAKRTPRKKTPPKKTTSKNTRNQKAAADKKAADAIKTDVNAIKAPEASNQAAPAANSTTGTVSPSAEKAPTLAQQAEVKPAADAKSAEAANTVTPVGPGEVGYGPITLEQHNAAEKAAADAKSAEKAPAPVAEVKAEAVKPAEAVVEPVKEAVEVKPADVKVAKAVKELTMAEQLAAQTLQLKPTIKKEETADKNKELEIKSAKGAKILTENIIKRLEEENVKLEEKVSTSSTTLEARKSALADLEGNLSSQSDDEKSASEKKIEDLKNGIKNIQEKDIDESKSKIEKNKTDIERLKKELESKTQALAAMTAAQA